MAEYHFWKEKRRTKKCLKDPNNSKSSKGSNQSNGSENCKTVHRNNTTMSSPGGTTPCSPGGTLSVHYNTNSTMNKSRKEVCLQTLRRWLERHFSLQKMSRTCRVGNFFLFFALYFLFSLIYKSNHFRRKQ